MSLTHWKKLITRELYRNPWWTYVFDTVLLPRGREGEYHYVRTGGSVVVIPVQDDGSLLMVNQYRYLMGRESLEFPAGGMKEGEDPIVIAHKELMEETGFDGALEKIGEFNPCKGIIQETAHVFIARRLVPAAATGRDETEEFEHLRMTVRELEEQIASNRIHDGMTMAAWAMARSRIEI